MARDRVPEVLDLEGALEAGGEEAAKGGDQGREGADDEGVELDGRDGDGEVCLLREEEVVRQGVGVGDEDGVRVALEAGEDGRTEVLRG